MKLTTRRSIDAGFSLALLILILVGGASYRSILRLREDQRGVLDAEEVLRRLGAVLSDLKHAETGQRGYLLTRREEFLGPYRTALASVDTNLAALRRLTADNPGQRRQLGVLEGLARRKVAVLAQTVGLARRGDFEQAEAIVRGGTGRDVMDDVRRVAAGMEREEQRVLERRSAVAERSARRTTWTIVLGCLAAFVGAGISRRRILGDLRAREQAERTLARSEESVRKLYRIASSQEIGYREKLRALLALGSERFGLSIGVLSHIQGDRYEVVEAHTPDGGIRGGDVHPLGDTYCSAVIGETDPVAVEHAAESDWKLRRCHSLSGLEAYLGVPVVVEGKPYGTLAFSDLRPRRQRFSESDLDFLRLLAQWIGGEIERHRAEAELRQREERYRVLVESASDFIYITDAQGYLTYVNPVVVRTLGYPEEELLGMHCHAVVRQDLREAAAEFYQVQLRDGVASTYYELPVVARDGHEIWLGQNVQILTGDGQVVGMQAVARDITRHRELERMKDEFLSVVSHELRTPLTAIRGSLGLLASGKLGTLEERGQRMLEIAAHNTDRLVRLVNDLLDIEKIESGRASMEMRLVDAGELIRQAADVMGPMAERAGVRLSAAPLEARVRADPDRVLQVLTNLLSNAVKFSAEGGTVRLEAEPQNDAVLFRVSDEGRGIPSDKLEAIFERFQQVDSSDARQKGGTGLGLPIARSIVQQHGGRMWVESRWGEGSTFFFTLPLAGEESAPAPPGGPVPLVLVCDEDAALCAAVSHTLEQSGYRVLIAGSGEEALRIAREERPAAILLDLLMSGMDGREALASLREEVETRDVPMVIFSTLTREDGASLMEAVDWVKKPADAASLVGAVDRAVGRQPAHCDVLIVEDDDGLAGVMEEMFTSRGVKSCRARSGEEAIELSRRVSYDLLVLDLGLPGADGFSVVEWLRRHDRLRSVPLLVYTAQDLTEADRDRLRLGPTEFMVKSRASLDQFEKGAVELLGRILAGRKEGE